MSASRFREGIDAKTKEITEWMQMSLNKGSISDKVAQKAYGGAEEEIENPNTVSRITAALDDVERPSTSKQTLTPELIDLAVDSDDQIGYEIVNGDERLERRLFYLRDLVNGNHFHKCIRISSKINRV